LEEIIKKIKENIDRVASVDASVELQRAMSLLQVELAT
jgi:hypothetical protein